MDKNEKGKMTLDEAISHLDDILSSGRQWDCEECRNEHVQLRDWMKELKDYKCLEEQGKLIKVPFSAEEESTDRLTVRVRGDETMSCRYEDCDTCEEYCPLVIMDGGSCPCLQDIIKKLAQYERLEKQGNLLKLPCREGDTIYKLCMFENGEKELIKMTVGCIEPFGAVRNRRGSREMWNVYAEDEYTKGYFKFSDFGKTVFLTQEDAEAAYRT